MFKMLTTVVLVGLLMAAGCCPKRIFGQGKPADTDVVDQKAADTGAADRKALKDDPYVGLAESFVEHMNEGRLEKAKELSRGTWDGGWIIVEGRGEVAAEELRGQEIDYPATRKRVADRVAGVPRGEVVLKSGLVLEVFKQKQGYRVVSIREKGVVY